MNIFMLFIHIFTILHKKKTPNYENIFFFVNLNNCNFYKTYSQNLYYISLNGYIKNITILYLNALSKYHRL